MKYTIGLVLCLAANSAFASRYPVTFGFSAVQCERVRAVVCVADGDYPEQSCVSDTALVVAAINHAARREILRFEGMVSREWAPHAAAAGVILVTATDFPYPEMLGYTHTTTEVRGGMPCVGPALVMLAKRVAWADTPVRARVLVHEMLHAMGARHRMSDPRESRILSRMDPGYEPFLTALLSRGDQLAIYAAYGDWELQ